MLTDCSSIQGSTASSSSDVMTLAPSSSWCAISIPTSASALATVAASTRLRIIRLIRPHARRILVTPDTSPSFGFTIRGGKEFGTGFFISSIERNGEAELKGMRIGDQILRINGFRVDDAVHRELIQYITNQDRLTLKVRSVGMLPIKEKDDDKLYWHAVKTFTNGSSASSESSYKTLPERGIRCKDVNITLNVAPRTKLGLGICKGPEWKPGIFVQFTKEKSVAREAGLRQGDQILSVNSIDFSDVLFSEAVAVMKSANKLEMIVRTAAGCDLFPGESSGYNSSASSVTGDQSPCWADAKSKRLTSVREEPTIASSWNEIEYMGQQRCVDQKFNNVNNQYKNTNDEEKKRVVGSQQQVNKTIIKLSEQGTSINNTFVNGTDGTQLPPQPLNGANLYSHHTSFTGSGRDESESNKTVVVEVHRQEVAESKRCQQQQKQLKQMEQYKSEYNNNNAYRHNTLQPTHSFSTNHTTPTNQPEFSKFLRTNACNQQQKQPIEHQQQQQQKHQQLHHQHVQHSQQQKQNVRNTRPVDSSSLSSAITEELKKRKDKQRMNGTAASNNNNNYNNNDNINMKNTNNNMHINSKQHNQSEIRQQSKQQPSHHLPHQPHTLKNQHQQSHCHPTPLSPSSSSLSLSTMPTLQTAPSTSASTSSATLGTRAISNTVNCSERNSHNRNHVSNYSNNNNNTNGSQGVPTAGSGAIAGIGVGSCDQHSALMDEFKRAHQRMFKNGFQETEHKERQDVLRNTAMMEDDVNHRTSRNYRNENGSTTSGSQYQIPPPPPQFASSPTQAQSQQQQQSKYMTSGCNKHQQQQQKPITMYNNGNVSTLKAPTERPPEPPATPLPDYDNVDICTIPTTIKSNVRPSYGYASTNIVTNGNNNNNNNNNNRRITMRPGTITIGEYEQPQQRREPAKFDFVSTQKRNTDNTNNFGADISPNDLQTELQNTLTRSKLKTSSEQFEHQSDCPLRNSYENYENVAKKLHSVSINDVATVATPVRNGYENYENVAKKLHSVSINEVATVGATQMRMSNGNSNGSTNGILKNGNRHSGGSGSNSNSNGFGAGGGMKNSDKTITFGN